MRAHHLGTARKKNTTALTTPPEIVLFVQQVEGVAWQACRGRPIQVTGPVDAQADGAPLCDSQKTGRECYETLEGYGEGDTEGAAPFLCL